MFSQITQLFQKININEKQAKQRPQKGLIKSIRMSHQFDVSTLHQFKEIYSNRLQSIRSRFSNTKEVQNINEISDQVQNRIQKLIGSFKRIQAQRVRAFEINYKEHYEGVQNIYSENDTYEIQDATGKIQLQLSNALFKGEPFNPLQLPYGVIIMVKGQYHSYTNRYRVNEVLLPQQMEQAPLKLPKGDANFTLYMSNPDIQAVKNIATHIKIRQTEDSCWDRISSVVIIGGLRKRQISYIKEFKQIVSELSDDVDVFLMPSCGPAKQNTLFPQHMENTCMVPKNQSVGNCSNPQIFESDSQQFSFKALASCGQNLKNLKINCSIKDDIELMKLIIEFHHLCPSSVFSLPIESYDYDPLILTERPHLMVHGKCERNVTQYWSEAQMRLVGIKEGSTALVNMASKTFDVQYLEL